MAKPLSYTDLRTLGQEAALLKSSLVQDAFVIGPKSWALILWSAQKGGWALVFHMNPSRPYLAVVSSKEVKKTQALWGMIQFAKAHLKGQMLKNVWLAKPDDRTLCFQFERGWLVFDCFPHSQRIQIFAGERFFSSPSGSPKDFDVTTAETLEAVPVNTFSKSLMEKPQSQDPAATLGAEKERKRREKIEKAIEALQNFKPNPLYAQWGERLKVDRSLLGEAKKEIGKALEKAKDIKQALDMLFTLAKKDQTKAEQNLTRIQKLKADLDRAPAMPLSSKSEEPTQSTRSKMFKGLQVQLTEEWQLWVGRKALENEELLKAAQPTDIWIHLRDYPGAHGLLRGPRSKEIPFEVLERACSIVAQMSAPSKKSWAEGELLDFYVVLRKFLRKPKGLGAGQVLVDRETVRRIAYRNSPFQVLKG